MTRIPRTIAAGMTRIPRAIVAGMTRIPRRIAAGVTRIPRTIAAGSVTCCMSAGGLLLMAAPAFAAPEAPVTLSPATSLTATSAVFEGVLNPHASATANAGWYFAYSTGLSCLGASTTPQQPEVVGHAVPVHAAVSGLEPNEAYVFCLVATSPGELSQGNEVPLMTLPAAPAVDSESLVSAGATVAMLEAQVNPNNQKTSGLLQYATSPAVNASGSLIGATKTASSEVGEGYGDQPLGPVSVSGLAGGTTYYYQAVAANAAGSSYGPVQSFTTVPVPHTSPATGITATTATLNGELVSLNAAVAAQYSFAYKLGSECAGESTTPSEEAGTGSGAFQTPSTLVTGLQANATYAVCLVAMNAFGSETDATPVSFTTPPAPPRIDSQTAAVGATEATLTAQIDPGNEETGYTFEYSTSETGGKLTGTIVKLQGASPLEGGIDEAASVPAIKGLAASSTYYYRVVAENAQSAVEGKPAASAVQSFTTLPVPHTGPVTLITATTATFNGELAPLDPNVATQYSFLYRLGSECAGESQTSSEEAGEGTGAVAESTTVSELQPNAEYSVCLVASNTYGSQTDPATVHFTTLAAPPKIDSETFSAATPDEAILEAQINPNNQETSGAFQYATSPAVNANGSLTSASKTAASELGESYGDQPLGPSTLTNLTSGTTYYYQAVAAGTTGTSYGPVQSFATQGPPIVSTGTAAGITRTTATLTGTVNPTGLETSYYFAYINEHGYQKALAGNTEEKADPYTAGETTTTTPVPGDSSSDEPQPINPTPINGLLPGETYHYTLIAKNLLGVSIGEDQTLTTTTATPPTVTTATASNIGQTTATLSGTVNTNSLQTEYAFEIATQPGNYGPATGLGSIGGARTETVTQTLGELQPATTYYYRITATNTDGTTHGTEQAFTTTALPNLFTIPPSAPLITLPPITFPTETGPATNTPPKPLTTSQKLAKALKACKKDKKKHKRTTCEKQAKKKYAAKKKKK